MCFYNLMSIVAIFGSSRTPEGHPNYRLAYELAGLLAREGYAICNGGYWGIMDAATRGARDAGGEVIGVTLEYFSSKRGGANALLTSSCRAASARWRSFSSPGTSWSRPLRNR